MSLVFQGQKIEVPGLKSISYLDDSSVAPRITDHDPRKKRVRAIVIHTTSGTCGAGKLKPVPSFGKDDKATVLTRYQTRTARSVSWDFTVDRNGVVYCQNDPSELYSWHATSWNSISLGIELVQDSDGTLYQVQMQALGLLVDELTRRFKIQRQVCWKNNTPVLELLSRADEHGGKRGGDMVGIFAHVHNTKSRGRGDPGPLPFQMLVSRGYEGFDFEAGADLAVWKERQIALGFTGKDVDGIAMDKTCAALEAKGRKHGLWVSVPSD